MCKLSINAILLLLLLVIMGSITFFQYDSYRNSRILLSGNDELLKEISYKTSFQRLQTHIVNLDKLVREFILTQGAVKDEDIRNEIAMIDSTLDFIEDNMPNVGTAALKAELDSIVNHKINDGIDLLNAYNDKGRQHAERMVSLHGLQHTNLAVSNKLEELERASEQIVKQRADQIKHYENRATRSNLYFSIFVCFLLALALFYIYVINRQQQQLIHELEISKENERQLSQVKDEFLAHMSHEIRTPLNAILGFIGLLEKEEHGARSREMIATIKDSGTHLLNIVNEILELSRLEQGMLRITHHVFDLHETIQKIGRSFREGIEAKGIRFELKPAVGNPLLVSGDEYRLMQILQNLLGNALKFTAQGFIALEVDMVPTQAPLCTVHFTVRDSGIGIAASKLHTVFDRFEQGDSQITRKYGGTGLGLYIVKQLVDLQHGSITVESEEGKGSTFCVSLTYTLADEKESLPHATGEGQQAHDLSTCKVLVVEDHAINQQLIAHWLGNHHIAFRIAQHGREAIDLLREQAYDLILMDIQMPEMDGYECSRQIRQTLHLQTPIIAMTAHALKSEIAKCMAAGMNDHIIKPIDEGALIEMINIHLPPATYTLVDPHYLHHLSNGQTAFMNDLLTQFLRQSPDEYEAMLQAMEMQDAEQLHRATHSFKTSLAYLGVKKQDLAVVEELEQCTDLHQCAGLKAPITTLYERVQKECRHLLGKL